MSDNHNRLLHDSNQWLTDHPGKYPYATQVITHEYFDDELGSKLYDFLREHALLPDICFSVDLNYTMKGTLTITYKTALLSDDPHILFRQNRAD